MRGEDWAKGGEDTGFPVDHGAVAVQGQDFEASQVEHGRSGKSVLSSRFSVLRRTYRSLISSGCASVAGSVAGTSNSGNVGAAGFEFAAATTGFFSRNFAEFNSGRLRDEL